MIPLNLVNYLATGLVSAVLALTVGATVGVKYERGVWQERYAKQLEAEKELTIRYQAEFQAAMERQIEATDKALKEKEDAIKTLKHDYDKRAGSRLFVSTTNCGKATGQTTTTSTKIVDAGTTREVELSQAVRDNLYREAERADELVESFRALEHWLIYQGLYKDGL